MNEIYDELHVRYAIVRRNVNDDTYEYFDGCDMLGRDKDNIIRIRRTKWTPDCKKLSLQSEIKRANDIVNGILKYDSESGYKYCILEVKITTRISNYIEVNI